MIGVGLLVTRIATVALMFTGLSRELARFQARSAFTCCGFTTTEAERVVQHPVRRRIIMFLMLMSSGVTVLAISSLIPVFLDPGGGGYSGQRLMFRLLLLVAGVSLIWAVSISKWVDNKLSRLIGWALRRFTSLEVMDYHALLRFSEGYSVTEISVTTGDWVVGKSLAELRLADEGIEVLGIHRQDGEFIGTPTGSTYIRNGDRLLTYGKLEHIAELEQRRADAAGDQAHERRVAEQRQTLEELQRKDRRPPRPRLVAGGERDASLSS